METGSWVEVLELSPDAPETARPWWPDGALFPGTGMQGHARNARAFFSSGMKLMGVRNGAAVHDLVGLRMA